MSCGGSEAPRCLSVHPDSADFPNGHTVLLAREERTHGQLLRDRAESPEGGTCSPHMGLQPTPLCLSHAGSLCSSLSPQVFLCPFSSPRALECFPFMQRCWSSWWLLSGSRGGAG